MRKSQARKTDAEAPKRLRAGPIKPGQKLLFKKQVLALIGDPSYSTVWEWMRAGDFPLAVELGPSGGRSSLIGWYAHEIDEWIRSRPRRQIGDGLHEFRGRDAKLAAKSTR